MIEDDEAEFAPLDQLIRAYLHQDMDMDADTVPEAIANFSRLEGEEFKTMLRNAMARFEMRHHNDLEAEFRQRYAFDFVPDGPGQSVPKFFEMVRTILNEPGSYRRFEDAGIW